MSNTLKIESGEITLNGVPVQHVTDFQVGTLADNNRAQCCLTFDIPVRNLECSNSMAEIPDRTVIENLVPEMLENFSTGDLLHELVERNVLQTKYDKLDEVTIFTGKIDGKA